MNSDSSFVVCVSFPPGFDPAAMQQAFAESPRPIEVIGAHYEDPVEVRVAKGGKEPQSAWVENEGEIASEYLDALGRCDALLALDVPHNVTELAPNLKFIQAFGSGVEHFDLDQLKAANVGLTNAAGMGAVGIAEFAIGRILEVKKRARELQTLQDDRKWEYCTGQLLAGSTIAIVGLGAIGRRISRLARAMEMTVLGIRRSWTPGMQDEDADEMFGPDGLEHVLGRADVVVLSAPDSVETADLINQKSIGWMKPGAVLCNVSRGNLVDEDALVEALEFGRIGAAILDVAKTEPPDPESGLWTAPNLYLSPHSANSMDGYADRVGLLFSENVLRLLRSEGQINAVLPVRVA